MADFQSTKELPSSHNGNPLIGYRVEKQTIYSTACRRIGFFATRFDSPVHGYGRLYFGNVLSGWICIAASASSDDCAVTLFRNESITIQGSALKVTRASDYTLIQFAIPWNETDIDQSKVDIKFDNKTEWIGSCQLCKDWTGDKK